MAKSLKEIIAGVEAELRALKELDKKLSELQGGPVDASIYSAAELVVGQKIRICGTFGTGKDESWATFEDGVYTVEALEGANYQGVLTVLLTEAGWIPFDKINKRVGIVKA